MSEAVAKTVEAFGGIDVVVNNASAIDLSPTPDLAMKKYDLMQDINCRGSFLLAKTALPHLEDSGAAHVLTLSPPLNLNPKWAGSFLGYTIAKYGMSLVTLGLAEELKGKGIAANSLWPRTTIATAAVANLLGGDEMVARSRTPEIMADSAHAILTRDHGSVRATSSSTTSSRRGGDPDLSPTAALRTSWSWTSSSTAGEPGSSSTGPRTRLWRAWAGDNRRHGGFHARDVHRTHRGRPFPPMSGRRPVDLAAAGFVESEWAVSGVATSYDAVATPEDGRFELTEADAAPFATRVLVRRPADAAAFSGVVLVEWLNVSGGQDAAPDYTYLAEEILRAGHVWIGCRRSSSRWRAVMRRLGWAARRRVCAPRGPGVTPTCTTPGTRTPTTSSPQVSRYALREARSAICGRSG